MVLWTRHCTNFTDRLPEIAEAVYSLAAESALIDGEAVAFRPDKHSDSPPCAQRRAQRGPTSSRSIF